jgi:nicotinic acid phosphoribosyltransferase
MATIASILDTDLYKVLAFSTIIAIVLTILQLTMQQAVLHQFPDEVAEYNFTNRSKNMTFTTKCVEDLKAAVASARLFRPPP